LPELFGRARAQGTADLVVVRSNGLVQNYGRVMNTNASRLARWRSSRRIKRLNRQAVRSGIALPFDSPGVRERDLKKGGLI